MNRKTFDHLLENPMEVFDRGYNGEPTLLHVGSGCSLKSIPEINHDLKPRVIVVDTSSGVSQLQKVVEYFKSTGFEFRFVDFQHETQTDTAHKILLGELHKDQMPIVMGGSDILLALVARACMTLQRFPRVVYLQDEALKKANGKWSYGKFIRVAIKSKKQPYLNKKTVLAFADMEVPFKILAEKDPTFEVLVGCGQPSSVSSQKEITTPREKQELPI